MFKKSLLLKIKNLNELPSYCFYTCLLKAGSKSGFFFSYAGKSCIFQ
ncbi:MAG: hypothetical protein JWR61_5717 [Ferruginibacter sp.]|nr:hypothetical protein [Ferruginibacter sp.]